MKPDSSIQEYTFSTVPSIQIGSSRLLAQQLDRLECKRIVVITDPGIVQLGLFDGAAEELLNASIEYFVFSDVESDPSQATVQAAGCFAIKHRCDGVVGFGGGSSMDVAKLVAALATQKQSLETMYGVEQVTCGRLPLVQVPTTAGTGSEVTSVSIVTTGETTKSGVVSNVLLADAVILDARLTTGLPAHITAATGIDAMVHAIEAYTSKRLKNPISDGLAVSALRRLASSIHVAVNDGTNLAARTEMLLGAMQAGQAFANAPVAGVHALAYPVGGVFHVAHGLSNSLVLPHVLRHNATAAHQLYFELAPLFLDEVPLDANDFEVENLAQYLYKLAQTLGLPTRLRDVNIPHSALDNLAEQAMLQQRLLINNPCEIDQEAALRIYHEAY